MTTSLFDDIITEADATNAPKATQRPVIPPKPDPVADALIQHGFAHSPGLLDINGSLMASRDRMAEYPWNLPSRLFGFPVEIGRQEKDGTRTITLHHPLLADHPYVKHVEATLGVQIDYGDAPGNHAMWWHAVDLVSAGMWRDLLDTARFTTPEHIAGAVAHGLQYSPYESKKRNGYISTTEARKIMAAIDSAEPADADSIIREQFVAPTPATSEKGKVSWPINHMPRDPYATAWGHILGIEAGWFAHDRAGFLGWTAAGRVRFPPAKVEARADVRPKPVEPEPPKPRVLADEIAPRPGRIGPKQMDLF